jgi:PAS domain S-box-containing protein
MNDPENAFPSNGEKIDKSPYSPRRLLIILIAGIFFAEILAMIVLYYIHPKQYWVETLLDASIMIVLIFPILYYFHVRPLFIQTTERNRSEVLLRKVLENLPVGVWIIDQTGKILHGNQASLKIWGGARYVGMDQYGEYKAWSLDTGKLLEPNEWGAARAIQFGETVSEQELEIECFDGSHKIIMNSAAPIYENEVIQGAIVVNRDITERTRAEQALAKSEALFKTAFQILPVGAWITDESGKIIFGNPAGQQIWAGAKYVGIEQFGEYKAWWVNTGKPIREDEWAVARAIRNGETSLNEEIEIECFDGTHKQMLNSAIPVRDEQGNMYGVFVINEDITQRKQAEQALINSNELIEKAYNSIDVLIAYLDRDFNFIKVNEAYASADGRPVEFFEGKNHFDLYPHPENQAIFQRVAETGVPYSVMEKPFEYPEQPERMVTYWNWRLQPVRGADGTVQGVVLSLVDVTERKRAELLLEHQNQDLHNLSIAEGKQRQLAESLVQSMLALNASLELPDVLKTILEQIQRTIPYDLANIVLIDDNSLNVVHHLNLIGDLEKLIAVEKPYILDDYPFVKKIYTTHQPVLIEDTASLQQEKLVPGMPGLRSFLSVPLVLGGHVIGIINLTTNQPGIYDQETARQLMAFAAPAALAVENARLYTAEQQARQLAETLNAISQALTQSLNIEKVMNTLLEYVCRLVPTDRAYIAISEDETNLTLHALRGYESEIDSKKALDESYDVLEKPYLQEVISTRKSLLIPDTSRYPGWKTLITRETIRSWVGLPIVAGSEAIGVLALASCSPDIFTSNHIRLSEAIISQASVAIQNAWLFEQVRSGHERLQSLSRRLLEVQESERRYIARELHDVVSQNLTALMFGLRQVEQEAYHPENILPRLAELKQMTDQVLEELHRLAMGLRPTSLDYLGLGDALGQLVKGIGEHYNISVHFKTTNFTKEQRLPDIVETNVYRIVQEALTNAVRHANPKSIDVILEQRDDKLIVIIEDDGVSFDTAHVPKQGRLGLVGMQERAQMLSGTLQVESIKGHGTMIVLEIPYADSNTNSG